MADENLKYILQPWNINFWPEFCDIIKNFCAETNKIIKYSENKVTVPCEKMRNGTAHADVFTLIASRDSERAVARGKRERPNRGEQGREWSVCRDWKRLDCDVRVTDFYSSQPSIRWPLSNWIPNVIMENFCCAGEH